MKMSCKILTDLYNRESILDKEVEDESDEGDEGDDGDPEDFLVVGIVQLGLGHFSGI